MLIPLAIQYGKPATFSTEIMTEIKFATSTYHRINQNDVHCLHPANDRPTIKSFEPLVISTVAARVQKTVQGLFQMVDILDLLTIHHLLKSIQNWITPGIQIRWTEHLGVKNLILRRMVQNLSCTNLCAVYSGTPCTVGVWRDWWVVGGVDDAVVGDIPHRSSHCAAAGGCHHPSSCRHHKVHCIYNLLTLLTLLTCAYFAYLHRYHRYRQKMIHQLLITVQLVLQKVGLVADKISSVLKSIQELRM